MISAATAQRRLSASPGKNQVITIKKSTVSPKIRLSHFIFDLRRWSWSLCRFLYGRFLGLFVESFPSRMSSSCLFFLWANSAGNSPTSLFCVLGLQPAQTVLHVLRSSRWAKSSVSLPYRRYSADMSVCGALAIALHWKKYTRGAQTITVSIY